ncbi:flagellin [Agathobacter rectalis]|nr:flagellin [Agathobacter rectalis]
MRRLIEISGNSDTDMADEMTRFSKESILQQAATSMLAQAEDE